MKTPAICVLYHPTLRRATVLFAGPDEPIEAKWTRDRLTAQGWQVVRPPHGGELSEMLRQAPKSVRAVAQALLEARARAA